MMHNPTKYPFSGTIKRKHIERTCTACPSQWEGKLSDGRILYGRYRGGHFRVYVSHKPIPEWLSYDDMLCIHEEYFGDMYDGYMTDNEFYLKLIEHGNGILDVTIFEHLYIKTAVLAQPFVFKVRRLWYDFYYMTPMGKRELKREEERIANIFKKLKKNEEPDVQN